MNTPLCPFLFDLGMIQNRLFYFFAAWSSICDSLACAYLFTLNWKRKFWLSLLHLLMDIYLYRHMLKWTCEGQKSIDGSTSSSLCTIWVLHYQAQQQVSSPTEPYHHLVVLTIICLSLPHDYLSLSSFLGGKGEQSTKNEEKAWLPPSE